MQCGFPLFRVAIGEDFSCKEFGGTQEAKLDDSANLLVGPWIPHLFKYFLQDANQLFCT